MTAESRIHPVVLLTVSDHLTRTLLQRQQHNLRNHSSLSVDQPWSTEPGSAQAECHLQTETINPHSMMDDNVAIPTTKSYSRKVTLFGILLGNVENGLVYATELTSSEHINTFSLDGVSKPPMALKEESKELTFQNGLDSLDWSSAIHRVGLIQTVQPAVHIVGGYICAEEGHLNESDLLSFGKFLQQHIPEKKKLFILAVEFAIESPSISSEISMATTPTAAFDPSETGNCSPEDAAVMRRLFEKMSTGTLQTPGERAHQLYAFESVGDGGFFKLSGISLQDTCFSNKPNVCRASEVVISDLDNTLRSYGPPDVRYLQRTTTEVISSPFSNRNALGAACKENCILPEAVRSSITSWLSASTSLRSALQELIKSLESPQNPCITREIVNIAFALARTRYEAPTYDASDITCATALPLLVQTSRAVDAITALCSNAEHVEDLFSA